MLKLDRFCVAVVAVVMVACSGGDKSSGTSSAAPSTSVATTASAKASATSSANAGLEVKEEELFARFIRVVEEHGNHCSALAEETHVLVKTEAATIADIKAAWDKMTPDEKKKKKEADDARAAQKELAGVTIGVCSIESQDFKEAYETLVPSAK